MGRKERGKVVLITGASAGIGKATAARLLREGHTVYGAARRLEPMAELTPHGLHTLSLDMTNEQSITRAVDTILNEQQRIDVLFNNAGLGVYASIEETEMDLVRHQFEVNLFGLARLTQLVTPQMRKQREGLIINNSSVGGKVYTLLGGWYYATKHALEGWSDCLRLELQQFGIHVVVVEPGLIKTEFGGIATPQMKRISGAGPYRELVNAMTSTRQRVPNLSPPDVIARVVSRAMRARRPRTRYAAGKLSRVALFMRRWCSDRIYDRLITSGARRRKRSENGAAAK